MKYFSIRVESAQSADEELVLSLRQTIVTETLKWLEALPADTAITVSLDDMETPISFEELQTT